MSEKQRLQKVLSMAGLGSRREMEKWIEQGWIKVNGTVASVGDSVGPRDKISVKSKRINNPLARTIRTRVILYHKSVGEICSRQDPEHSKTVFDNLPKLRQGRWVQIGRLDINTSGLLLLTNDGELANYLMHPSRQFEREYAVRVNGEVTEQMINEMLKGVELEDGLAQFKTITYQGGEGKNQWYHVVLCEGRNREVRRIWQSQGVDVSRLIRIRYGDIQLPRNLSRGKMVELEQSRVEKLMAQLSSQ
ncbi:23S rRNA pseudouridine(2605) synthase RluB [Legionella sp. W05-934-2]|uniref:23S rRNA pseudouridine(2605) synthase RluB n=1 Tax=Legionella sp. W05-934-2 TaxID=1198649 RepID=UPI0034634F5B